MATNGLMTTMQSSPQFNTTGGNMNPANYQSSIAPQYQVQGPPVQGSPGTGSSDGGGGSSLNLGGILGGAAGLFGAYQNYGAQQGLSNATNAGYGMAQNSYSPSIYGMTGAGGTGFSVSSPNGGPGSITSSLGTLGPQYNNTLNSSQLFQGAGLSQLNNPLISQANGAAGGLINTAASGAQGAYQNNLNSTLAQLGVTQGQQTQANEDAQFQRGQLGTTGGALQTRAMAQGFGLADLNAVNQAQTQGLNFFNSNVANAGSLSNIGIGQQNAGSNLFNTGAGNFNNTATGMIGNQNALGTLPLAYSQLQGNQQIGATNSLANVIKGSSGATAPASGWGSLASNISGALGGAGSQQGIGGLLSSGANYLQSLFGGGGSGSDPNNVVGNFGNNYQPPPMNFGDQTGGSDSSGYNPFPYDPSQNYSQPDQNAGSGIPDWLNFNGAGGQAAAGGGGGSGGGGGAGGAGGPDTSVGMPSTVPGGSSVNYGGAASGAGNIISGLQQGGTGGALQVGAGAGKIGGALGNGTAGTLGSLAASAGGVLNGLQRGGVAGYAGAGLSAVNGANQIGKLAGSPLYNSSGTFGQGLGLAGNVLGVYNGVRQGGVMGYGSAALNAYQGYQAANSLWAGYSAASGASGASAGAGGAAAGAAGMGLLGAAATGAGILAPAVMMQMANQQMDDHWFTDMGGGVLAGLGVAEGGTAQSKGVNGLTGAQILAQQEGIAKTIGTTTGKDLSQAQMDAFRNLGGSTQTFNVAPGKAALSDLGPTKITGDYSNYSDADIRALAQYLNGSGQGGGGTH